MTKENKDAVPVAELGDLIAGYLDVKLPARNRRRRFGSWKSWRRHWVEVKTRIAVDDSDDGGVLRGAGVDLVMSSARLGRQGRQDPETTAVHVVHVPAGVGVSVCRTASRSRGHAFVVATPQSAAEVGGDVFLATRSEADTERWMAVLRAAVSSSPSCRRGPDNTSTVAHRAPSNTSAMAAVPRGVLSAASIALLRGRRLSRSEGDLLIAPLSPLGLGEDLPNGGPGLRVPSSGEVRSRTVTENSTTGTLGRSPHSALRQPFRLLYGRKRAETMRADMPSCPGLDRLSTSPQVTSGSALSLLGGKIASGLISAGLGLILSTPGGSETEDNDVDVDLDFDDANVDVPPVSSATPLAAQDPRDPHNYALALDRRRESSVSVASGIYEEIRDSSETAAAPRLPVVIIDRVYENAVAVLGRRASNDCESHYEDPALLFSPKDGDLVDGHVPADALAARIASPPPLPPRQNLTPISELRSRTNGCVVESPLVPCVPCVDSNGYVQMGLAGLVATKVKFLPTEAEPAYLPMSPIRPFRLDKEDKNM